MWIWRKMKKISWMDKISNKEELAHVNEIMMNYCVSLWKEEWLETYKRQKKFTKVRRSLWEQRLWSFEENGRRQKCMERMYEKESAKTCCAVDNWRRWRKSTTSTCLLNSFQPSVLVFDHKHTLFLYCFYMWKIQHRWLYRLSWDW